MNRLMSKGFFKNVLIACVTTAFLGTTLSVEAQGQGQALGHDKAPRPPQASQPLLPAQSAGTWWPWAPLAEVSFPTFDYYGSQYLPYLYSIGLNTALLVDYADFFYQIEAQNVGGNKPYKSDITALANSRLVESLPETLQESTEMTGKSVETNLLPGDLTKLSEELITDTPGTDTVIPCSGPLCNPNDKPKNKEFNADTLLGTSGYADSDKPVIEKLLIFLSGNVDPPAGVDLSLDASKRAEQLSNSEIQRYLLASRSLIASQSVAIANLNFLAKEREIIPNLGEQAAMTTLPTDGSETAIKNASQLQLEQFLINRRVGNSSWYASVNTAKPIEIQRETLFVLAEIQQQLMQLRLINERLLAAMSVMQFQMAQLNKSQMTMIQQNVKDVSEEEGTAVKTDSGN